MHTADPGSGERTEPDIKAQERSQSILTAFRGRFKASRAHFQDWRTEARALYDLAAGRQWDSEDEAALREQERPMVTFNVAGKYMDAVQGLQINNRQDIKFAAREPGKVRVNEQLTGAVAWGRDLTGMSDDETDAFYDCILTGMGFMEGYMDHDIESSGVPGGARCDPLECFPDPVSRKRNFEDARFMIRLKWYSADEYQEIVGEMAAATDSMDFPTMDAEDDDPLAVIEQPQDYDQGAQANAGTSKRRAIADYQWWERHPYYLVTAEGFGQQEFDKDEWEQVKALLEAKGVPFEVENIRKKCYYRAFIAGSQLLKEGRSPYQHGFTIHGITGKRDRNKRIWYGIGRAILDPQKWVNKFFSTLLYAMMTNAKGGIMAEENTFKDARKAESEWANPNSITWLKEGALQKGKIEAKPEAKYPQGMDRLMQFSLEALPQVSGLNLELMGLADRVQAGVVEAQRKQSAMAIIAWAFDAMRRYYRGMGRMLAQYVKDYVPENTLVLISGENGKQYVPLVKQQLAVNYDIIVDEAPTSVNQQERVWAVLQTIIPQLLQAGMAIPPQVLDYSPLPADLVEAWKQALKPDPKKQQISEQQLVETLKGLIAENKEKESSAMLNQAKAMQIAQEMQQPAENPQAQMQLEAMKAQIEAQVELRIKEFQTNRQEETKLLLGQMKLDNEKQHKQAQMLIDAKLDAMRIRQEADSQVAVAAISTGGRAKKPKKPKENGADPIASLTSQVSEIKAALAEIKRPRKHKIIRDTAGEIAEVITE
jgi:hypothetical protein